MRFNPASFAGLAILLTSTTAAPTDTITGSVEPRSEDGEVSLMNYNDSCYDCYMDGSIMKCRCRGFDGFYRGTAIDLNYKIGNVGGRLAYGRQVAQGIQTEFQRD